MKMLSKVVILSAIVALATGNSFARSIFINPGAKATVAGGSSPAYAGDVSVIYSNPAALSKLKGREAMLSVFSVDSTAKASGLNNVDLKTTAVLPFLAAYVNQNDYTFALGYYAAGGGVGKANNAKLGLITINMDAEEALLIGNLSASNIISDTLSVGLGIDLITRTYKVSSAAMGINVNSTGSGIQATGGVYYKAADKLNTGFVLRSGATVKMKDPDMDYKYPLTYGLGAEYAATDLLTLSGGIDSQNYSATDKWKDVIGLHLGARYQATEKMYVAGGLLTEPAPFSKDNIPLSPFDTLQYNMTYINLGAGFDLNGWKLSGMYTLGISDKPEQHGVSYEYPTSSFRIDIGHCF